MKVNVPSSKSAPTIRTLCSRPPRNPQSIAPSLPDTTIGPEVRNLASHASRVVGFPIDVARLPASSGSYPSHVDFGSLPSASVIPSGRLTWWAIAATMQYHPAFEVDDPG